MPGSPEGRPWHASHALVFEQLPREFYVVRDTELPESPFNGRECVKGSLPITALDTIERIQACDDEIVALPIGSEHRVDSRLIAA